MTDLNIDQPDPVGTDGANGTTKSGAVSSTSTLDDSHLSHLVRGDRDDLQASTTTTSTSASQTTSPIVLGAQAGPNAISGPSSIPPTETAHNVPVSVEGHATPGGKVRCGGCKEVIDQSSGGVVVQFGNALWHTPCFRCAKCSNQVTADTNLLLLSDGSPVCSSCSYQCFVCKNPITEEAIMTGDDSYHAACFTCRSCNKRIEELVFAKTSQGIYCMACHNERVARSRRHAEAKRAKQKKEKERESSRAAAAAGKAGDIDKQRSATDLRGSLPRTESMLGDSTITASSSSTSHSTMLVVNAADDGQKCQPVPSTSAGSLRASSPSPIPSGSPYPTPGLTPGTAGVVHGADRILPSSAGYDSGNGESLATTPIGSWREHNTSPSPSPSALRYGGPVDLSRRTRPEALPQHSTPPLVPVRDGPMRRGSGDDVERQDVVGSNSGGASPQTRSGIGLGVGPVSGLSVPTSRADKRRSINPAISLAAAVNAYQPEGTDAANSSASSATPSFEGCGGRISPLPPSPLRASFTEQEQAIANKTLYRSNSQSSRTARQHGGILPSAKRANTESAAQGVKLNSSTSSTGPPRSSSLADQLSSAGNSRQAQSRAAELANGLRSAVSEDGAFPSSARGHHTDIRSRSPSAGGDAPRIDAPELPSLNFSLSDPDFALLLKDGSPQKKGQPSTSTQKDKAQTPSTANSSLDSSNPTVTGQTRGPTASDGSDPNQPRNENPGATSLPTSPVMPVPAPPSLWTSSSTAVDPDNRSNYHHEGHNDVLLSAKYAIDRMDSEDSYSSLNHSHDMGPESALPVLQALLASASSSDKSDIAVNVSILQRAVSEIEHLSDTVSSLKVKYMGAKRTSQHYIDGLSVAADEYEREVALRLEAEAEVARLRAQVHDKTARLSVITMDERRQANLQRRSRDLASNLSGLEKDISKLKAERDVTLAEVQELEATKRDDTLRDGDQAKTTSTLTRSLTNRLNKLKEQYKGELEPLSAERESLTREIGELKDTRKLVLEESTALSAKNEELAELNSRLTRQAEVLQDGLARNRLPAALLRTGKHHMSSSPSMSSIATTTTLHDVIQEDTGKGLRNGRPEVMEQAVPSRNKFKWYKSSKGPEAMTASASLPKPLSVPPEKSKSRPSHDGGQREHIFQQHTILRFSRCEHCGDKLWGLQELRCAVCGIVCHSKCVDKLHTICNAAASASGLGREDPAEDAPPSMFGRELSEQIQADGQPVPVIVTKCIEAVEAQAMTYEGVYRKTGGSSLSKYITQLFDRGNYDSFDLQDMDKFNDLNSITSVMKSYFRSLPDPLLTYKLHESLVAAASIKDVDAKSATLSSLINELPVEHYNTLRVLMLHLNRVKNFSQENFMNSRNLGVVFGPTLMRSPDPARGYGDTGGKALFVEWMIDNAPQVLEQPR